MPNLRYLDLPCGITCIDTMLHRPGLAACYLIQEGDMVGLVDTGTNLTVPLVLELLQRRQIERDQVRYVMPTHVHLDHAGGTGRLMQELPAATLVIHPRGARHMIDPTALKAGVIGVYGEETYQRTYGELVPVPAERVLPAADDFRLDFNGRELRFLDTPGHARHHYVIWDAQSRGLFTGDTFGASYPELNQGRQRFIFPPTTPVQFDPSVWKETLNRLLALDPERIYVTHFGMHGDPATLARQLEQSLDEYVAIAEDCKDQPQRHARINNALMQYSVNTLLDNGCGLTQAEIERLLEGDMRLNAQGLDHWLGQAGLSP